MGVIENAEAYGYDSKTGIWHSTRQPISLPEDETFDIIEWFHELVSDVKVGDTLALVDAVTEEECTFKELKLRSQSVAAGLSALGIKKGDVVLLLSPNSVWFPVALMGVLSVGAIISTANPISSSYEISNQLKDCSASLIITTSALYSKVEATGKKVILIGAECLSLPRNAISFSQLLATDPGKAPRVKRKQSETAALLYSSGTTGLSKGVVIPHRALLAQVLQQHKAREKQDGQINLVTLPMFHVFGLTEILLCQLLRGTTLVILPKFEFVRFLRAVEKYRVTNLPVVPPILVLLVKRKEVENYDLSSVREISYGGAPIGTDVMIALHARFPLWGFRHGFGMTELCGTGTSSRSNADYSNFGAAGELVSSSFGRIVHLETGQNLPPYGHGELWLKGPHIMTGYLNNKKATEEALDSDGWLHTGDLCYFDETGQLWIVDRLKELIKCNGYQVAPAELEALLLTHPHILDAAVVGRPDEYAGEVPIAFVVRSANSSLSDEQIKEFVSQKVAPYKRLRSVSFIDAIPKSAAGKLLRRNLLQLGKAKL